MNQLIHGNNVKRGVIRTLQKYGEISPKSGVRVLDYHSCGDDWRYWGLPEMNGDIWH